jgi:hypothetical protein
LHKSLSLFNVTAVCFFLLPRAPTYSNRSYSHRNHHTVLHTDSVQSTPLCTATAATALSLTSNGPPPPGFYHTLPRQSDAGTWRRSVHTASARCAAPPHAQPLDCDGQDFGLRAHVVGDKSYASWLEEPCACTRRLSGDEKCVVVTSASVGRNGIAVSASASRRAWRISSRRFATKPSLMALARAFARSPLARLTGRSCGCSAKHLAKPSNLPARKYSTKS